MFVRKFATLLLALSLTLSLAGFGFLIFGRKPGKKRGGKYSR